MHTKDLQNIGNSLYREISPLRHSSQMKNSAGTGAGGDTAYHIDRRAEEIIISSLEALHEPLRSSQKRPVLCLFTEVERLCW